jgi:hypothetical protein
MVNKGTACLTEELGWFRIVFTVDQESLRVGLRRFLDGLREVTVHDRSRATTSTRRLRARL